MVNNMTVTVNRLIFFVIINGIIVYFFYLPLKINSVVSFTILKYALSRDTSMNLRDVSEKKFWYLILSRNFVKTFSKLGTFKGIF